jgi:hypothetical protein
MALQLQQTQGQEFGPSGANHAPGLVPDPGSSAGTSRYLCENATWETPSGAGTVTSVGLSVPTPLQVTGSPIINSGTISLTWGSGTVPVANIPVLTLAQLPVGAVDTVLTGTGSAPAYSSTPTIAGVTIDPTAASLNQAIATSSSLSGTGSASGGPILTTGDINASSIYISSDDAVVSSSDNVVSALQINHQYGGPTMSGARETLRIWSELTTASSVSNVNPEYNAINTQIVATTTDNGNAAIWALGAGVATTSGLGSSAFKSAIGYETDMLIAGGIPGTKFGFNAVLQSGDANTGSNYDAAYSVAGQASGTGWMHGLLFNQSAGAYPMNSSGTLIATQGSITTTTGIDFTSTTFTGSAFKSVGFNISPAGLLTTGSNGGSSGGITFEGSTSGSAVITVNSTATAIGCSQPLGVGANSGALGAVTLFGSTSGSTTITTPATGGILTVSTPITSGVNGTIGGSLTIEGSSSGSFTIQASSTGSPQYQGTSTNDNAASGGIGQYITSGQISGVSLTSASVQNITSISLTAGDWEVSGVLSIVPAGTTVMELIIGVISLTSASTTPVESGNDIVLTPPSSAGSDQALAMPHTRVSVASTTTVYLNTETVFTTSTCTGGGILRARRVR